MDVWGSGRARGANWGVKKKKEDNPWERVILRIEVNAYFMSLCCFMEISSPCVSKKAY